MIDGGAAVSESEGAGEPDTIGRYHVLSVVGSGGMGRVYAAYDPALDRRVALKVVRPRAIGWMDAETARRRLLREAQALASLAHPNVVPVFDVGTFEMPVPVPEERSKAETGDTVAGRDDEPKTIPLHRGAAVAISTAGRRSDELDVFVAMEFIEGLTLTQWLRTSRPWQETLRVLVAAGRGIAAAHAVGIVHGDVKPSNVLVADDGRILVADFGLARPSSDALSSGTLSGAWADDDLDTHSQVLGTPPFMAPEQHRGKVDIGSDQFALCVTMWAALFDCHPFAKGRDEPHGKAVARIRKGMRPFPRPSRSPVPARVAAVLTRGLSADPQRRWSSVTALLDRLERAQHRPGPAIALAVLVVGAGVGAWAMAERAPAECAAPDEALAGAWDDDRRAALSAEVAADAPQWRRDVLDRLGRRLDAYALRWREQYATTCAADQPDRPGHARALQQRRCLQARRTEIAALVDVLAGAEDEVWALAPRAAADLEPPESCGEARVEDAAPVDSAAEDRANALLARGRAHAAAGQFQDAYDLAVRARDEEGASLPTRLQARLAVGNAASELARLDEAVEVYEAVVWEATSVGADEIALAGMLGLLFAEGVQRNATDAALAWGRRVEQLLASTSSPPRIRASLHMNLGLTLQAAGDLPEAERHARLAWTETQTAAPERRAAVANALGNILRDQGRVAEASAQLREALRLREEGLGAHHPDVAIALNNLGLVLLDAGDSDEAKQLFSRALDITYDALGREHPRVAVFLNNLANVAYGRGELEEAEPLYAQTVELLAKRLGDDHLSTLTTKGNLGLVVRGKGEAARALGIAEDVLEGVQQTLPAGHPSVAMAHNNLAGVLWDLGRLDEARTHYETAVAQRRAALGDAHPLLATSLDNLARLSLSENRAAEALPLSAEAFAIWHTAYDPAHTKVAIALTTLGRALLATEHLDAACFELEHALYLLEAADDADPVDLAAARLALAEALTQRATPGVDRVRARSLARRAAVVYRRREAAHAEEMARARRLLGEP